jgi:predicted kinase
MMLVRPRRSPVLAARTTGEDMLDRSPAALVITGVMASGKSTVAQLVAERLPRAAHVRGDVYRRMIVSGRQDLTPSLAPEAMAQLRLRYRLAAMTADAYVAAGFTEVVQDIIFGDDLPAFLDLVQSRPLLLVVLAPRPDVIETRERARSKSGYAGSGWSVADLDRSLRLETPRIGLWIDSSEQAPAQTADEILRRAWDEAVVEPLRRDACEDVEVPDRLTSANDPPLADVFGNESDAAYDWLSRPDPD